MSEAVMQGSSDPPKKPVVEQANANARVAEDSETKTGASDVELAQNLKEKADALRSQIRRRVVGQEDVVDLPDRRVERRIARWERRTDRS